VYAKADRADLISPQMVRASRMTRIVRRSLAQRKSEWSPENLPRGIKRQFVRKHERISPVPPTRNLKSSVCRRFLQQIWPNRPGSVRLKQRRAIASSSAGPHRTHCRGTVAAIRARGSPPDHRREIGRCGTRRTPPVNPFMSCAGRPYQGSPLVESRPAARSNRCQNRLDVGFRGSLAYVTGRICRWKAKPHMQTARKVFIQEQTRT